MAKILDILFKKHSLKNSVRYKKDLYSELLGIYNSRNAEDTCRVRDFTLPNILRCSKCNGMP